MILLKANFSGEQLMSAITLLEQLAQNVHHHTQNNKLINALPEKIRDAFLINDMESIKLQLSTTKRFANESHVVQINLDNIANLS
jgi:hypothetical protein